VQLFQNFITRKNRIGNRNPAARLARQGNISYDKP
jgi:hypothetical protein